MGTSIRIQTAIVAMALIGASAAAAAPPAKGALEPKAIRSETVAATEKQPAYITDVQGNRVRLVGPRFLTNPARALDFPGRNELHGLPAH